MKTRITSFLMALVIVVLSIACVYACAFTAAILAPKETASLWLNCVGLPLMGGALYVTRKYATPRIARAIA